MQTLGHSVRVYLKEKLQRLKYPSFQIFFLITLLVEAVVVGCCFCCAAFTVDVVVAVVVVVAVAVTVVVAVVDVGCCGQRCQIRVTIADCFTFFSSSKHSEQSFAQFWKNCRNSEILIRTSAAFVNLPTTA